MKILAAIFFTLLFSHNSFSQPYLEWVSRYIAPENVSIGPADMGIDSSGNIIYLGNDGGFLTLKYNSQGTLLWRAKYTFGATLVTEPKARKIVASRYSG